MRGAQGDAERGRSLFEGVLRNFPKRLDVLSVYLDQEVARGDAQRVRALFDRSTHLALPPKKMKVGHQKHPAPFELLRCESWLSCFSA